VQHSTNYRMKIIKLYGERNTGTNYFTKLIDQNFDVEQLPGVVPRKKILLLSEKTKDLYFSLTQKDNLGWKHSAVSLDLIRSFKKLEQCHFITISKNPYSFLLSLFKRPYHYEGEMPKSFSDFIRREWKVAGRDNYPGKSFENPIALWNYKNESYLHLKNAYPNRCYIMTYESLLENYNSELQKVQAFFDLKVKSADFENYSKSTKDKSVSHKDYQKYYLNEEWREDLSKEDISFINKHLDPQVMEALGYSIIS